MRVGSVKGAQPETLLDWLADLISAGGGRRCLSVTPDAEGTLRFELAGPRGSSLWVEWCLPRRREGWSAFRDGSIRGEDPQALRQVSDRLTLLLRRRRLDLLEVRNRELAEITFDDTLLERLCPSLLKVGVTRLGPFRLEQSRSRTRGVLELVLRSDRDGHSRSAEVRPAADDAGTRFEVLQGEGPRDPELAAAVELIGFVLALSAPAGAPLRLERPLEEGPGPEPSIGLRTEGRGDKQNSFLYDTANNSGLLMSALFRSKGRLATVFHADRECAGFAAWLTGVVETVHLPQQGQRPRLELLRQVQITDTADLDAIMVGCEDDLSERLEGAIETSPQLLFTLGTCVAKVIGDDLHGTLTRALDDRGAPCPPALSLETTLNDGEDNYRQLWAALVERFQPMATRRRPRGITLIGFADPRGQSLSELDELIDAAGIERCCSMVPTFDLDELPAFGEARVHVRMPSDQTVEAFREAERRCQAPVVEAPSPYGFKGTTAWLEELRRLVELPPLPPGWLEARTGALRRRWGSLRSQAAEHGVALVLTDDHFGSRFPEHRAGLPWLSLLAEMGFALQVFVVPSGNPTLDEARRAVEARRLEAALAGATAARRVDLARVDELQGALEAAEAELVYSEVWRDRRATSAGKVPLSFLDFEMGFEGAVRTLERLLAFARAPFYRRFRRYLPVGEAR